MKSKGSKLDTRSVLVGLAAGVGAAAALRALNKNPDQRFDQVLVNRALDKKYREAREDGPIQLDGQHRYVIFSDHHKGGRTRADDFMPCEQTYLDALDHYAAHGYTLIILGDAEELQEEPIKQAVDSYQNVFQQEARFHPDRLIRVYGNHDISWKSPEVVQEYFQSIFPDISYREGILFEYHRDQPDGGEIFLVHGFQGTLESDIFSITAR
jgi:hypothetical protein